jgi:hypothetical protein
MSGGKSARAESFAFGVKRYRGALLVGTALVVAPTFVALPLGAAQAGDLIIGSGTYVNNGNLVVDDVITAPSGRLINKGKLKADEVTNSGQIKNKRKLEAEDLTNKKGGVILNKGTLTVDDEVKNSGRIVNNGTLTADSIINKQDGVILNKINGDLEAGKVTNRGGIVNDGLLTADSLINKNGGVIHNQSAGDLEVGKVRNSGSIVNDGFLTADSLTNKKGGVINNNSDGAVEAGSVTNSGRIVNDGFLTADSVANKKGGVINNKGDGDFEAGIVTNSGRIINDGTLIAGGITNNKVGVIVNNGTVTDTLTNFGTVTNNGSYNADVNNIGAAALITNNGTWIGNLLSNTGTVTLSNGSSWTGNLTNNKGGTINLGTSSVLATNKLVSGDVNNAGVVNVFGTPTVSGAFNNLAGGILDLAGGATPTANTLTTGSFKGSDGSTIKMADDLSGKTGKSDQVVSKTGNSGTTTIDFTRVGGPVVLGDATHVIVNQGAAGSGTLSATATGNGVGEFGLVNVSLQSAGNGNWDLVRSLNTGATGAPVASIMAALAAIDTSFHQSTAPFVASPQSQDPDKWTGGVWSRATSGQTTTKSTAFESFGGTSADLRVKTNFDAYEVGVDTGILNFGNSGWNGHFGIMGGAVNATANELLSGSGTSVKFDIPFAGVYGVMTHGPFFMDIEARHDWVDTHVTNVPANLNNTELKGHGDSLSGSAGYHFDLVNNWFVEPAAGFGLTQTQFDTLATNLGQTSQGIAAGTISFDSVFSMLVHGGARVGTSFVVADKLVLQPFGTLSAWRELGGQSSATFTNGPVSDPLTLSRVGTFYQAGIGLSAQLLNTGFIGFARGDFRWGDNLNGSAVVGGLRYTFGP